ncbi:hypothetical protein L209DRAFT_372909 [Thermothelomyces heterothallicus CBS 203.75]
MEESEVWCVQWGELMMTCMLDHLLLFSYFPPPRGREECHLSSKETGVTETKGKEREKRKRKRGERKGKLNGNRGLGGFHVTGLSSLRIICRSSVHYRRRSFLVDQGHFISGFEPWYQAPLTNTSLKPAFWQIRLRALQYLSASPRAPAIGTASRDVLIALTSPTIPQITSSTIIQSWLA